MTDESAAVANSIVTHDTSNVASTFDPQKVADSTATSFLRQRPLSSARSGSLSARAQEHIATLNALAEKLAQLKKVHADVGRLINEVTELLG